MTCNQQHRCSPDHAHSRLHNFAYRNGEGVGDREGGERGQVLISCKGGKGPWHRRKHCFGGIFASRAGDLAPREIDLQPRLTLGCLKVKTWHKDTNGSALYMNLINLTGADANMVCLNTPIVSALRTTWWGQPTYTVV